MPGEAAIVEWHQCWRKPGSGMPARTVHLHWPCPLPGNEHGEVEYELRRDDWLASGGLQRA